MNMVRAALLLSGAALLLGGTPASAQSTEHSRVFKVVTDLFDAMRTRDTSAMRSAFVANASMQSLGDSGVKFDAVDGWISGVARAKPGVILDERLANERVHVDADLASVWVEYWFFVGDQFSHCGVDSFQLVRDGANWKVFSVVDTRRTKDCGPAPGSKGSDTNSTL